MIGAHQLLASVTLDRNRLRDRLTDIRDHLEHGCIALTKGHVVVDFDDHERALAFFDLLEELMDDQSLPRL